MAATPPTTDEVRPAACVACGRAGRPVGGPLGIHGHGGRERWVLGVLGLEERPGSLVVLGRRFLCLGCGCVMLVVPREVSPRRRYLLGTIVLALAGFGLGETAGSLRARLAPGRTFDEGWPVLRRWLRAIAAGTLLRWIRGVSELAGRALAERVSAVLAEASGVDARSASVQARVWAGMMASSRS